MSLGMDTRDVQLAELLLDHSTRLQSGEKILIEAFGTRTYGLVEQIVQGVYARGGMPYVRLYQDRVSRALLMGATEEQMALQAESEAAFMAQMDCYVGVRGFENVLENSDVPADRMKVHASEITQKVHLDLRVPKTRWVVLRYPNPSFAQSAKMSSAAFEDFYYRACLTDYAKMAAAAAPLAERMKAADAVHILGPGTDLRFSLKEINAVACAGDHNVPDGECFSAPVRDSVQGTITFNTPSLYDGQFFDGICFTFKDGRIEDADCRVGDKAALHAILDRDDGARHIGEFAIAFNPEIREPMLDILFDEKIAGSFHFTPGDAYDVADNGNRSTVHWDLVCRQLAEHGGGSIAFDGEVIRQDGLFLPADLLDLNP